MISNQRLAASSNHRVNFSYLMSEKQPAHLGGNSKPLLLVARCLPSTVDLQVSNRCRQVVLPPSVGYLQHI